MAPSSPDWLLELPTAVPRFLQAQKGRLVPGYFRYSYSGDLAGEQVHWGLGNTTFALKILHTLNLLEKSDYELEAMANFILSFENSDGYIFDPLIARRAWLIEKLIAVRSRHFNNFWHEQTKRAETRQAISSLRLIGAKPRRNFTAFPQTPEAIEKYLEHLEWVRPWGAASHFSHLVFFLQSSSLPGKNELIAQAVTWVNRLQHAQDGAWYKGHPGIQQKINGAMKVVTGFKVADYHHTIHLTPLIDLCLGAQNDAHACDNFNIVYVLAYTHQHLPEYRVADIQAFAQRRLQMYRDQHYYPALGGFSFLPRHANKYYYGAKISRGLPEPDIHGTALFLWGICMMAQILNINDELGFREFIP